MTETNEVVAEQQVDTNVDISTLQKELEDARKSIDSLVAKRNELLNETKKAKEERRNAEKLSQEKLVQNAEFEKLWKQEQEEKDALKKQLSDYMTKNREDKLNFTANRIANELTSNDADRSDLLSIFIVNDLKNIADETGNIEQNVLDSIKRKFETDKKYTSLTNINKSQGGNALGNPRGAQENKTLTRQDFNKLSPFEQGKFFSKGGKLTD